MASQFNQQISNSCQKEEANKTSKPTSLSSGGCHHLPSTWTRPTSSCLDRESAMELENGVSSHQEIPGDLLPFILATEVTSGLTRGGTWSLRVGGCGGLGGVDGVMGNHWDTQLQLQTNKISFHAWSTETKKLQSKHHKSQKAISKLVLT